MIESFQMGPTNPGLVLRALRRHPSREAFSWDGGSLSYGGASALVGAMQAVMADSGFVRGQRLAVLAGNTATSWCAGVAAQASGLSTTPLHPLGSLDDHRYQLDNAECDGLIVDTANFSERGGELAASGLPHVLTLGPAEYGADLLDAAEQVGASSAQDLSNHYDIALLNYTSGTSGRPKAAVRRHATLVKSALAILADFDLPRTPRYLAVAPISHVAGSKILPALLRGGTVHLQHGFEPQRVLATLGDRNLNTTLLVPSMIYAMLDDPDLERFDLSSLELLLYGAAAMSPTRLREGLERIGPVFSQLYGQTEGYPISVLNREDHDLSRPELFASCGVPVSSTDVRLLDDHDIEVAEGTPGEICVRSPYVMDEYWKQPELTAETLKAGWLHTGDVALSDERGYLFIVDRKKDMIITGGFNVFSREVEDALTSHPDVAAAAVIGIPHERWGEAVHAVVTLRPGVIVDSAELIGAVKERKGSVYAPKTIEFRASLPLTPLGKVDKKALRAPYWDQRNAVGDATAEQTENRS